MGRNSARKTDRSASGARQKPAKSRKPSPKVATPFLSADEAALYLRVSVRALEHFRSEGGGPDYRKHGGSIVYHRDELDRWSAQRRYSSTADKAEQ